MKMMNAFQSCDGELDRQRNVNLSTTTLDSTCLTASGLHKWHMAIGCCGEYHHDDE